MSMSDPISDLLTRIRNAGQAGHDRVLIPHSRLKEAIVKLMVDEGFVADFDVRDKGVERWLEVGIRYDRDSKAIIRGLQRVSKPSRRIYVRRDEIPYVRNGLGLAILTTPKGVISDRDARREGVGGEVICYVW
jgi:small subunit ribosomal protein S8